MRRQSMNSAMVIFFLGFLVVGFQNCSKIQAKDLAVPGSSVGGQGNPDEPILQPTPPPNPLMTECDQAADAGKILKKTIEIEFEDPGHVCAWGEGGNLSTKNSYIRARIDQVQQIAMVASEKVCNLKLTNIDEQEFLYDDNIFLLLNGYVLSSTSDFSRHLIKNNGFYKYDWSRLIDKDAQNSQSDSTLDKQFCAGADMGLATCAFPVTENVGSVQLQFDNKIIQGILGMTDANQVNLTMVTTGDNDDTDCQHVPLRFSIDVEYFVK